MRQLKAAAVGAALSIFCSFILLTAAYARAEEAVARQFDISPQSLATALSEFARQSQQEILFAPEAVSQKRSRGLHGNLQPLAALELLLKDSGLAFTTTPNGAILVGAPPGSPSSGNEGKAPNTARGNDSRRGDGQEGAQKKSFWDRFRLAQVDQGQAMGDQTLASSDTAPDGRPASSVEEVVVTAQKRVERLQDVPISIAVLGGRDLDRSTAEDVSEMLANVPGVANAINLVNRSGGGHSQMVVRGVTAAVGGSAVGYYLDSIPFGFIRNPIAPDSSAFDLERVEVLRGPQGTLYGVNALNGVIRVLTKDADLDQFELKARTSTSSTENGGENYRGDVAVNVPLIDGKLGARAVLGYQDLGGWIDKPIRKDANDAEIGTARLKINAQPTDRLSMGLLAWFSRSDFGAPANSPDGRQSTSILEEPATTDYDAFGLKLDYGFSAFSATGMTSYIDYKTESLFDYAPFGFPDTQLNTLNESTVFSQEVSVNSTHGGPWRWSVGGIYRDVDDRLFQIRRQNPTVQSPTIQSASSESFALFGEVTWSLLDGRFELTGGLRYFEDKIKDRESSRVTGVPAVPISTDSKFDNVSPRVVLTWHPADRATVYASYSEGFRSGLNQAPLVRVTAPSFGPAGPDNLTNYELGAKGSIFDGRVSFDTAVYYIDWRDVQQSLAVVVASPNVITTALINAPSASGPGFEIAASGEVVDGLALGVNFSWNDLEVDQTVASATGAVLFEKGSRLTFSPKKSAGATAEYTFPLGGSRFEGRFSASAHYVSEQSNRALLGPTLLAADGDSFLFARTSLALKSPDDRWVTTLFVDNLGNENGIASRDLFSPQWHSRVRPRTVGVQLEYRY